VGRQREAGGELALRCYSTGREAPEERRREPPRFYPCDNAPVDLVAQARLERTPLEVLALGEEPGERAYWLSRPPAERFQALELLRQIVYGYDPASTRLQRVLAIAELA
jgi:hypothetical protein